MKPRSLRVRLLLVMLLVIAAFWLIWSSLHLISITREQSGWLNNSLRETAHQILTSLPENIALLSSKSELLSIPGEVESDPEKMSYQVWTLGGTRLLGSIESPESSLKQDFSNGFSSEEINGRQWRVYAVTDASGSVQVQTGKPMEVLEDNFWRWTKVALLVALVMFTIFGVTLWVVIGWSLHPVTRLQRSIARRHKYDLMPLPSTGLPDEVKPLVESFNQMLVRIDRAINNERRFIADAAHELRTPMAAVQAHAQVALHSADPQETRAALERLIDAVERGTRLAQQLLDTARLESGDQSEHEILNIAELVSMVTHEFDAAARQRGQTVSLKARSCTVLGNIDELGILISNLIDNAIRHSGEKSHIDILCQEDPETDTAMLRVNDNGSGIPDERERERIFDRFFRACDSVRSGSGLGLSLVRRIADSHGAKLEVGEGPDKKGLSICVYFPPIDDAPVAKDRVNEDQF